MWQFLKGNSHELITLFLQDVDQTRIYNPVKHLR